MPFNGAGVYSAPAADFPVVTQTVISSTHFNNTINDIATALSTCLTKDGQQVATANIPFGGFRVTNVGITAIAGSVGTPAINVSDTGTGLYRSAASELAVTVAGSQVARFASTGLIVTGTATASTSVVTPLVDGGVGILKLNAAVGTSGQLQIAGTTVFAWNNSAFVPQAATNTLDLGIPSNTLRNVFATSIDSGTTGSLSLKTNNGTTQFGVVHVASAINFVSAFGNSAGSSPGLVVDASSETNAGFQIISKGTGAQSFQTGMTTIFAGQTTQFQVLHTASATRNITITGSNGGNPTIGVTAGSLAITPAVVIAGQLLQVGTNPASSGAGGTENAVGVPYNNAIASRNSANSGDLPLVCARDINGVNNIVCVGFDGSNASAGVEIISRSGTGAPGTGDLAAGRWTLWRDTSGATTKLYYNNAGAIIASAAFT